MISSLVFALSSNIDNFVVGLTYGIKRIKINFISLFVIALITTFGTVISMTLGKAIFYFISAELANLIGGLILIIIGLWGIIKYFFKIGDKIINNPEKIDRDKSLSIDAKEAIILAIALSFNNIGLGVGASFSGLNLTITSVITFIFSFLMLVWGRLVGMKYFSKALEDKAMIFSAILIVILGIYEIIF